MRRIPVAIFFRFVCFVALLAGASAAAASDSSQKSRELFQRAYAQAEAGGTSLEHHDSDALRTHPLYAYVQAARIRYALAGAGADLTAADRQAQAFLSHYERDAVARALRDVWLGNLAQRQLWQTYLDHYRAESASEAQQCHSYTARIVLGRTDALAGEIRARWLTPKRLPDCERPFDWLRSENALSDELIEARARLALEENNARFARQIAAELPRERAEPLLQWASLLENPQRQIDALIAHPARNVEADALLAGWTRLARRDRAAAAQRFPKLVRARQLSEAEASPYALALALPLAWDRNPDALEFFARVHADDVDDYALEWQARAALWSEQWPLVAKCIAAMSDEQRTTARWRYWAARAAERTREPALARQLYESVLPDDNFYSMMAAARLGRPLSPHPETLAVDRVQLAQIGQLPEFVRARELLLSDLRPLANLEWLYGLNKLSDDASRQAIHLAARLGWYDQAVATATRARVFNDYVLLYPRPFDREVRSAAKFAGVSDELIYSVMRQESLYRQDALSSAGARGLLQLLPETARRTARAWKRPAPGRDDLFDPGTNVTLGAAFLRTLIDRFNGQTIVALAGYNAGPNAAKRWLPGEAIDADVWIENIPYNETRSYVQRILWHSIVFKWLETGEPQATDIWLARVAPLQDDELLGKR